MNIYYFFFFKQKTAYELRISDWSSDVCSSDLLPPDYSIELLDLAFDMSDIPLKDEVVKRIRKINGQSDEGEETPEALAKRQAENEERQLAMRERLARSEERRLGQECVSTFRTRWAP